VKPAKRDLWTPAEKDAFLALVDVHGRAWGSIHTACEGRLVAESPACRLKALESMGRKLLL